MTLPDSGTHSGMPKRHGPPVRCVACQQIIPTDTTMVRATVEDREMVAMFGVTFEDGTDRRPGDICEPCWDTAVPDPEDLRWLRLADQAFSIQLGRHPHVIYRDCEWCGRPLLLNVARRRLASCSKRCQVYTSQERWPKPKRELAPRTCATCGACFTPRRRDHHFCSAACRQAAYRCRERTRRRQTTQETP